MRRRNFLKVASTASALFTIVPRHVLGGAQFVPPSEKIHLALIGCGGRGRQVLRGMLNEQDVRAIAVADPATSFSLQEFYYKDIGGREPTASLIEEHYRPKESTYRCRSYVDFKEMLDAEKDLDAVVCATPDHLHAFVSATCMRAGKHVYCEKPLTHNLWEADTIAGIAKETGVATQMGNQGHSTDGIRRTCELIWAGAIGDVTEVKAWVSGHRWNPTLIGIPSTQTAPPAGLNWDLWLGPRKERAFEPAYFPVAWRDFWAFGNSNIGDFACHDLDAACWALDLDEPTHVEFSPAGVCNADIGPHGCIGYYKFAANSKRGPIRLTWYDGGLNPECPSEWPTGKTLPDRGVLFLGTEGAMFCPGAGGEPQILNDSRRQKFEETPQSIARVANHAKDWIDACRGQRAAGSNFAYGSRLTKLALLGALSLRTGKAISWDAASSTARDLPSAAAIVKEDYRSGWEI